MKIKKMSWLLKGLLLCLALPGASHAMDGYDNAANHVKNQICADGLTVDHFLDRKLSHSHQDLGWRSFADKGGYEVERSFKASKFAEVRYRWHVDGGGSLRPASGRAQALCSQHAKS